jgi:threonine/homoserine/homoserine lactone efflux protein
LIFTSCTDIFSFVVTVVLITASGALAPGPLFFQTISQGTKTGARSGFILSISHTVVEFSLIMLLAFGFLAVRNVGFIRNIIGILGGVVLIIFGLYQIVCSLKKRDINQIKEAPSYRLFFIGILFTALNPYYVFNLTYIN